MPSGLKAIEPLAKPSRVAGLHEVHEAFDILPGLVGREGENIVSANSSRNVEFSLHLVENRPRRRYVLQEKD